MDVFILVLKVVLSLAAICIAFIVLSLGCMVASVLIGDYADQRKRKTTEKTKSKNT